MNVKIYPILRTIGSLILPEKIIFRPGSGGSYSSKYCYSVWLRHLVQLHSSKLIQDLDEIKTVAEIGPGDSLGFGISALLSGAETYYAFDVIEHANLDRNIKIVRELEQYFEEQQNIPHEGVEMKSTKPKLEDYSFPEMLYGNVKNKNTYATRTTEIVKALKGESQNIKIEYVVPWDEKFKSMSNNSLEGTVDLIFSQAVMEHVINIEEAYKVMYKWLKPGGIISHQIDYKAHEMSDKWDGHWFINENLWKFLLKGRKYSINRLPHSAHVKAIEQAGFTIKNVVKDTKRNNFPAVDPKIPAAQFSSEDRVTGSALIQAVKL